MSDFNTVAATPLIPLPDGSLLLLQYYSIVEALYESPFYWMGQDKKYMATAFRNRGLFTENFAYERLREVFSDKNVFSNIDLYEGKNKTGEIDVLVTFGDRLIILQAKSKRLTLGARKGNDGQLRDDFKKAIQHSYDQGLLCAESLGNPDCVLMRPDGTKLKMQFTPREIFIVNLISDHYPALSFQSSQFLKFKTTEVIKAPFVMDVFLLDAMTEMLKSPLRLMSYMRARVKHIDSFQMSHELTALAYHLKLNFWKDDKVDFVMLDDDIAVDLDIAMAVRRDGVPGAHTPDGILTRFSGTKFESLIAQIERQGDPATIELGFDLLAFNEDSCRGINNGLTHIIEGTTKDGKCHDFSVGSIQQGSGVTFHCNILCDDDAARRLRAHCINRKYASKVSKWFGVCLDDKGMLQFGLLLDFPWERSDEMDAQTAHMRRGVDPKLLGRNGFISKLKKIGRNEKCPCGSGKKFKRCHM
ncbi:Preprotein translocase subunit SecA [Pseudomonas syringae pv. actinidiae]|uniref:Preprotein translocase subunit SecA n=1 Tax=Pseudomonas syringae pv. actinidiae TaxID=103796 RepID=A0A2V0QJL7_PSESF|nr:Preprotein translocase subunit SecA [Pseudomonas syringae pv. actinidiae]